MRQQAHRLTVVMCNYNHGRYVARAIEAIVSQSRPPDEFIILDDGSTDNSVAIIEPFALRHPYIRFVKNERNTGIMAAVQHASAMVTGDYVYWGAADDYVLSGFFEAGMLAAEEHPHVGIIAGKWKKIDARENELETVGVTEWDTPRFVTPEVYLAEYLMKYPAMHSLSLAAIYNCRSLEEIGGLRRELGFFCDTFAIRAISLKHGCYYIPTVFACWRHLSESLAHTAIRNPVHLIDIMARGVWQMRRADLRSRFDEAYVVRWAQEFRAIAVAQGTHDIAEKYAAIWEYLWETMRLSKRADRVVLGLVFRLLALSKNVSIRAIRHFLRRYPGDISCYKN